MAKSLDRKSHTDSLASFTAHRATTGADRMAYMADLLLELKDMATVEGHATLAGLLALAHMEALNKAR